MSKITFLLDIAIMRINFILTKIFHRKILFVGKCCCRNLHISEVDGTTGNRVELGQHVVLRNCRVRFEGNNHTLCFGDGVKLENVSFFFEKDDSDICIGDGTWIGPECELSAFDHTKIEIGKGSIFAKQCMIRTSDSHIIKNNDGEVINQPKNITIGSHVWLGQQTFVLKGARIPDGCVVGARSTVTASLHAEHNAIIVGQPAKIIKDDIQWEL